MQSDRIWKTAWVVLLCIGATAAQGQNLQRRVLHSESDGFQWMENFYNDENGTRCSATRLDNTVLTPPTISDVQYECGYFKCWSETRDGLTACSLYDTLGNCLIPPSRRVSNVIIDPESGIAQATDANSSGCMRNGRVIIPFEYNTISRYHGFYFARRDHRSTGCDVYTAQGERLFSEDRGVVSCRRELGRLFFIGPNTVYDETGKPVATGKIESVVEGEMLTL